jgi:hypothetical protein
VYVCVCLIVFLCVCACRGKLRQFKDGVMTEYFYDYRSNELLVIHPDDGKYFQVFFNSFLLCSTRSRCPRVPH